jgi:pyridoxal phosphate enzyme (YggS family)
MTISHNLSLVNERIAAAAKNAGRSAGEIRMIAVSKTKPPALVNEAILNGQKSFGENTIQDALTKINLIRHPDIEWHFIGHLQTNKVRELPGRFHWLHSLDNIKIARKLSTAMTIAQEQDAAIADINILLQVNVSRDPKKYGLSVDDVFPFIEKLLDEDLPGVNLRGLMTIGEHGANSNKQRNIFSALRDCRDRCAEKFSLKTFNELSMGMSNDYVDAIMEGATMIRIGTGVFGERISDKK